MRGLRLGVGPGTIRLKPVDPSEIDPGHDPVIGKISDPVREGGLPSFEADYKNRQRDGAHPHAEPNGPVGKRLGDGAPK